MSESKPIVNSAKALIHEGELEYISRCVLDFPNIETGGDLFGFWTYSGHPVIQYVIGPGKKANHQVAFFNQDLDYLKEIGDALRETHGLQHIGEWHSHHRLGLAEPSMHDSQTVRNAIGTYGLQQFFLVITNIRHGETDINGYLYRANETLNYHFSGWVLLKGESPIRKSFDHLYPELVYQPLTALPNYANLVCTTLHATSYVKPTYTDAYWLQETDNHRVLKKIIESMRDEWGNANVYQDEHTKHVYLKVNFFNHELTIHFGESFPETAPEVRDMRGTVWTAENQIWSFHDDLATDTLSYLRNVLSANVPRL